MNATASHKTTPTAPAARSVNSDRRSKRWATGTKCAATATAMVLRTAPTAIQVLAKVRSPTHGKLAKSPTVPIFRKYPAMATIVPARTNTGSTFKIFRQRLAGARATGTATNAAATSRHTTATRPAMRATPPAAAMPGASPNSWPRGRVFRRVQ